MSTNPLVTSIRSPQYYYEVNQSERFKGVCRILDEYICGSVIIFCRTKKDVDHLSEKLLLLNYRVASYHGDLSPTAREKALTAFSNGEATVLALTDIPNELTGFPPIDLILFSIIPQDPDSYIQRIIRLETVLGVTAVATLITNNEIKKMAFIKRATKSKITSKPFMEPHHIIQKKQDDMRGMLAKEDSVGGDEHITLFSKQLLTEYPADKVVLFLLNHGFQSAFSLDAYPALTPKPSSSKNKSKDTGSHDVPGFERLFIAIGKTDDITDNALKDFLYSETSIEQHHYSEIKIFETFSFFLVSEENAEVILEIFRRKKRGKRSIVERAKGKDAKKKT